MRCLRCGKSIKESYSHNSECPLCIKCQAHEGRALITESEKDISNLDTLARLDVAEVFDNEKLHVILDNFIELEGSEATLLFQPIGLVKHVAFDNTASLQDPRFEPFKDILEMPAVIEENDGEYTIVIDLMEMEVTEELVDQFIAELSKPSEDVIEESGMSVDTLNDNINDLMRSFRSEVNAKFADDNLNEVEFIKNEYIDKVEKLVFRSEANITLNAIESAFNEVFAEMDRIVASYPEEGDYVNRNYFDKVEEAMLEDTQRELDIEDANDRLNTLKKEVLKVAEEKRAQGASDEEVKDFLAQNMRTFNRKLTLVLDRCYLNQEDETAARKAFEDMVKSGNIPEGRVEFIKVTQEESFGYGLPESIQEFTIEVNGEILQDEDGNAYHFDSYEEAQSYIEENNLENAEVVKQYGKAKYEEEADTYYTVFTAPSKEVYDELGNEEFVEDYLSLDEAIAKAQELVEAKACFSSEVMKITNEGSDRAWSSLDENESGERYTYEQAKRYIKLKEIRGDINYRQAGYAEFMLSDNKDGRGDYGVPFYYKSTLDRIIKKAAERKFNDDFSEEETIDENNPETRVVDIQNNLLEPAKALLARVERFKHRDRELADFLDDYDIESAGCVLIACSYLSKPFSAAKKICYSEDGELFKVVFNDGTKNYFYDRGVFRSGIKDAGEDGDDSGDVLRFPDDLKILDINESVSKKPQKSLKEGVWSVPFTQEKAIKLKRTLDRIDALTAEQVKDELYDVFGSDELFDDLENTDDLQAEIKQNLRSLLRQYSEHPESFTEVADDEALDILFKLVENKRLGEALLEKDGEITLQDIANEIEVSGPYARGERMPDFNETSINESEYPDAMRYKYYEAEANSAEDAIDFTYVTQEGFTSQDVDVFVKEVKRAITALINFYKYTNPFTLLLTVKARSGKEDGYAVLDIPFNQGNNINEDTNLFTGYGKQRDKRIRAFIERYNSLAVKEEAYESVTICRIFDSIARKCGLEYSVDYICPPFMEDTIIKLTDKKIELPALESMVEADEGLPAEVTIPLDDIDCPEDIDNKDEVEEIINNYLSDNYNYLVSSYDYKFSEESIIVSNIEWDEEDTDLEETYLYVVHSDVDENNVYQEFDDEEDAIEYARDHADDETWVDRLIMNGDEVVSNETIWSYTDEDDDNELDESVNELVVPAPYRNYLEVDTNVHQKKVKSASDVVKIGDYVDEYACTITAFLKFIDKYKKYGDLFKDDIIVLTDSKQYPVLFCGKYRRFSNNVISGKGIVDKEDRRFVKDKYIPSSSYYYKIYFKDNDSGEVKTYHPANKEIAINYAKKLAEINKDKNIYIRVEEHPNRYWIHMYYEIVWEYPTQKSDEEELEESRADIPNPDAEIVFEVLDADENIIETFTGDNVEALIEFVNSHEEAYYVTKKAPEDIDGFGYSEPETATVSSNVFDRDMDDELTIDMLRESLDESKKEHPYKCDKCGANLDPGEKCDCENKDKLEENISIESLIKALQGKEITLKDEFYYDVVDNIDEEDLANAFKNNGMVDENNVVTLSPGLKVEYVSNSNPGGAGYINFKTTNLENNFEFFISNEYENVKEFLACTDTGLDANFDESDVDDLAEDIEDKHIEVFRNGKVTREDTGELTESFIVGDERLLDPEKDAHEYSNMVKAAELLTNASTKGRKYYVDNTYLDRGLDWEWTTICYDEEGWGSIQVLSPRDWLAIVNAQTDEDLDNAVAQLKADKHFSDKVEESIEDNEERVYIIVNGRNDKVMAQINDNDLYYRWCKTRTSPKVQLFTYDEAERLINNQARFGNSGAEYWYIDRIDDLDESLNEEAYTGAYHLVYGAQSGSSLTKEVYNSKDEVLEKINNLLDTYKDDPESKVYSLEVFTDDNDSIFLAERDEDSWTIYYNEIEDKIVEKGNVNG